MSGGITRLPPHACPVCKKPLNAAGTITFNGPTLAPAAGAGDWTICSGCLSWLVFEDAAGALRVVTDDEWAARSEDERLALTKQRAMVWRAFHSH